MTANSSVIIQGLPMKGRPRAALKSTAAWAGPDIITPSGQRDAELSRLAVGQAAKYGSRRRGGAAEMQMPVLGFTRRRRRLGNKRRNAELRKRARAIRRSDAAVREAGAAPSNWIAVASWAYPVVGRMIRLVRPVEQKARGNDQMQRDDRDRHKCGDLSAVPSPLKPPDPGKSRSYHDLDLGGLGPDLPVASPEVAG
jgi:hypothetical protein